MHTQKLKSYEESQPDVVFSVLWWISGLVQTLVLSPSLDGLAINAGRTTLTKKKRTITEPFFYEWFCAPVLSTQCLSQQQTFKSVSMM